MKVDIIKKFPIEEITNSLILNPKKSKKRGITTTMLKITIKSINKIVLIELRSNFIIKKLNYYY